MCDPYILAYMSIRIAVYIHCQMNENPCSNHEIHVLFEHMSELGNTLNEPCIICMPESVAEQTDYFAHVFVRENVAFGYDVVPTL